MNKRQLNTLTDRVEISATVIQYATSIDTRNWQAYRSCFTDELEIQFPVFNHGAPMRLTAEEWTEKVRMAVSGFQATQHLSTNHVININGNEATCVSNMQAQHYLPSEHGDNCYTEGGYYTNALVRTNEGWKITRCTQTVTWRKGNFGLGRETRSRPAPSERR